MRSHRRRTPLEHVLVAGDSSELPAICALLALLPVGAYGQVYVEAADDAELIGIRAPARMTVSRLAPSSTGLPGDALCSAVHTWLGEWMPEDDDPARALTLWIGASAHDRIHAAGAPLQSL